MSERKYRVEMVDIDYYKRLIKCQSACPVHTDAQGYVNAIKEREYQEAYVIARQPNPFAAICGRVCRAHCESACRRGELDLPVSIRALKRFAVESYEKERGKSVSSRFGAEEQALVQEGPRNSTAAESVTALARLGKAGAKEGGEREKTKVAVVGSGPSGLACAGDLVRRGYAVTVFEALSQSGGLFRFGIPEFRLPREVIDNEIGYLEALGVEVRTSSPVRDLSELFAQGYKAIFLATGAQASQKLGIPGEETRGVTHALEFLKQVNAGIAVGVGERVAVISDGDTVGVGEKVAVIGGGNSAIDAARMALRLGAKEVTIVYRRSREEMPAALIEVEAADTEGIKFQILSAPTQVVVSNGGRVGGIECVRMELGEPDASGRRRPVPVAGSEFLLVTDSVIVAVGQAVDQTSLPKGLAYTRWGTLSVDPDTLQTNIPGVFAGGDVTAGPADIISAVGIGKKAATSIDEYLRRVKSHVVTRGEMTPLDLSQYSPRGRLKVPRQNPPLQAFEASKAFAEVEEGYGEEMARQQASRCLQCGVQTVFNGDLCILCGGCVDICPQRCLKLVRLPEVEGDGDFHQVVEARYGVPLEGLQQGMKKEGFAEATAMIKDETRCTRCALCAQRCPTGAIAMESFSFSEEIVYQD